MADVKSIVRQLRALASDEECRPFIARDRGCVPGLTTFLMYDDDEVVAIAAESLHLLSGYVGNREIMKQNEDLISALENVLESRSDDEGELVARTRQLASATLDNIRLFTNPSACNYSFGTPKPKTKVTLRVPIVDDAQKVEVEKRMLGIHGLISVTFGGVNHSGADESVEKENIAESTTRMKSSVVKGEYVTAYTTSGSESIVHALETAGYRVDELHEEPEEHAPHRTPLTPKVMDDPSNGNKLPSPKYPTPPAELMKREKKKRSALVTTEDTSLEARLEAQRRKDLKKKHKASRIFSKIGKALYLM